MDGGADYIERNAFVLVTLIQKLNQELIDNSSPEKLVIVGPSMGGLISRYALAYMEKNSMPHNTRLWISFDAPHNGANIPIGVQDFLAYYASNNNKAAKTSLQVQIENPAAKELLLHHYLSNSALAQGAPGFRDRFVSAMNSNGLPNSNGFPINLRKIALVDGSLNGTIQPSLTACGQGLDLKVYFTIKPLFLFKVRLFRGSHAQVFFSGSYGSSCTVFTGSQLFHSNEIASGYAPSNSISYDIAPGGVYNALQFVADQVSGYSSLSTLTQIILNILILRPSGYGTDAQFNVYHPNHCFIPTKSALAFKGSNADLAENLYSRNLVCTSETPFDTYYGETNNLDHVYIDPPMAQFAINEINGMPQQPTFGIPGLQITGQAVFCPSGTFSITGGAVPAGTSVVWNPGSIATIGSGQGTTQVRLDRISNGHDNLSVTLSKTCVINQTLTPFSYYIGGFGSGDYPVTGPSSASCNSYVTYSTVQLQGATNYAWFYPSNWTYISGQGTYQLTLRTGNTNGYFQVGVRVANACDAGGSPAMQNTFVSGCSGYNYTVSPNPATSTVNAAVAENSFMNNTTDGSKSLNQLSISEINICDQTGNLKIHKTFSNIKNASIDVSMLSTGIYIIEIKNANYKETQKLQILKN